MFNFSISTAKNRVKAKEAIALYCALHWGQASDYSLSKMQKALRNTNLVVSARTPQGKLIGLARVLSDEAIHTTIADLVIHPAYQKRGIGKKMMEKIKERYGETGIFVDAFQKNKEFFKKCGYQEREKMVVLSKRFKD